MEVTDKMASSWNQPEYCGNCGHIHIFEKGFDYEAFTGVECCDSPKLFYIVEGWAPGIYTHSDLEVSGVTTHTKEERPNWKVRLEAVVESTESSFETQKEGVEQLRELFEETPIRIDEYTELVNGSIEEVFE